MQIECEKHAKKTVFQSMPIIYLTNGIQLIFISGFPKWHDN